MLLGVVAQAQNFAITATTEAAIRKNIVKGNAANYGFGMINDTLKLIGLTTRNVIFTGSTSKNDIGLGNVDNTSDLNKPVSTATQTALNLKQNQLNGTGFVKASGTTISYDNSTYLSTSTAASTYLPINNPTATGILTAPTIANSLGATFATTSGNVGIGTASPSTKLSVSGSVGINTVAQSFILNNATGVYSTYQYNGTSVGDIGTSNQAITGGGTNDFAFTSRTGNLVLGTGSIERMRIFSNGNIGVGTPTDAGYKLDVNGTIRAGTITSQSGALISARNLGNSFEFGHSNQAGYGSTLGANAGNGHSFLAFNAEAGTNINTFRTRGIIGRVITNDVTLNRLQFQRTTSISADNQTPVTDMTIDGSGNMGIGTTSPNVKLEVQGTARFQSPSQAGYTELLSNATGALHLTNGHSYFSTNASAYDVYFQKNGNSGTNMIIKDNGNVGVGILTPSNLLHIKGTATQGIGVRNSHLIIESAETAGVDVGAVLKFGGQSGNTVNPYSFATIEAKKESAVANNYSSYLSFNTIQADGGSPERMRINGSGNVGIGTTAPAQKLTVNGDALVLNVLTVASNNNEEGGEIGLNAPLNYTKNYAIDVFQDKLRIFNRTDGIVGLQVNSNGNVGIGTTTDAGYKLSVVGGVSNFGDNILLSGGAGTNNKIGFNADATNYYIQGISSGMQYSPYSVGNFTFTSGAGNWSFTNGKVGIGTTTPVFGLDIRSVNQYGRPSFGGASADATRWAYFLNPINSGQFFDLMRSNNVDFRILTESTIGGGAASQLIVKSTGNVGIGTDSPAASAILDITSTTQGVLFPRLTTEQINAISSPANGLTVYNTTLSVLCFYDGTGWRKVSHSSM
jgi:hypothetical protein